MPSQPFQRLGLLHTDKGPVTARIRQAEKAQSDTLKVVDELFDHVAGETSGIGSQHHVAHHLFVLQNRQLETFIRVLTRLL
jgi:hypothetical protein